MHRSAHIDAGFHAGPQALADSPTATGTARAACGPDTGAGAVPSRWAPTPTSRTIDPLQALLRESRPAVVPGAGSAPVEPAAGGEPLRLPEFSSQATEHTRRRFERGQDRQRSVSSRSVQAGAQHDDDGARSVSLLGGGQGFTAAVRW